MPYAYREPKVQETEGWLKVSKLSGKRTAVNEAPGETSTRGRRRGKSANTRAISQAQVQGNRHYADSPCSFWGRSLELEMKHGDYINHSANTMLNLLGLSLTL